MFSFRAVSGPHYGTMFLQVMMQKLLVLRSEYEFIWKPSWVYINNRFYEHTDHIRNFASNDEFQKRQLRASASVLSIPKKFYDMEIKPRSVEITDNSTDITLTLVDDGIGNFMIHDLVNRLLHMFQVLT